MRVRSTSSGRLKPASTGMRLKPPLPHRIVDGFMDLPRLHPQTEVLIVGAGPVGLTLAVDLGQKGIRCTLIEKKPAPEFLPKMERCNARTMEIYRRMGLSQKIRAAGLRRDVPMDV